MKITSQNIDNIKYIHASDQGLLISFVAFDDHDAILLSRQLGEHVGAAKLKGVLDLTPGMNNLLISYDSVLTTAEHLKAAVLDLVLGLDISGEQHNRHWRMPVCYGGDFGPDLVEVADAKSITPDDVITLHTQNTLSVAIMGFLPGLAYMKGVDEGLYMPRRSSPRQHVPALSLGIAMDQTVIYPLASPGGWNLIGRVPVRPFDPLRVDPVLFRPGDDVSFFAIDLDEYHRLDAASAGGEMVIAPEGKPIQSPKGEAG